MYTNTKNISLNEKILITLFFCFLYIYIFFYFKGNQSIFAKIENPIISTYKSYSALLMTIISIIFYCNKKIKDNSTSNVFKVFAFFAIVVTLFNEYNNTYKLYINQFTSMTLWVFVYLFFYTLFSRIEIPEKRISKLVTINTILFFILFLTNYLLGRSIGIKYQYIESYYCIAMLPLIFIYSGKSKKYLIYIVIAAAILSAKRTGMITCCSVLLLYYFTKEKNIINKIKSISSFVILALLAYFLASYLIGDQLALIIERFNNISEDGGSGRDTVFEKVFTFILNSSETELFFGHGYNTVVETSIGYSAHNDFLEVTYDYGLIGLIIYLSIYISLFSKIKHIKSQNYRSAYICSLIIFLINSTFSHMILFPNSIIVLCSFWGITDGYISSYKYK